eukprot:g13744.t1
MQTFAKTLVHTGHVQYDEAASAEPLKGNCESGRLRSPDTQIVPFRRQTKPAMLAPVLTVLCLVAIFSPSCFILSRPSPRLPSQPNAEPSRASSQQFEGFGTGSSMTIAMTAIAAFTAKVLRSKVTRHARIVGTRDDFKKAAPNWEECPKPEERVRNYYYGQRGFKKNQIDPRYRDKDRHPRRVTVADYNRLAKLTMNELWKEPARMKLGHITDATAIFKTQDCVTAVICVKEVGSYQVAGTGKVAIPAKVPEYRPIQRGKRLEKEPGEKRPPVEDGAYLTYVDEKCNLYDTAKEAAPSALTKDIICDRGSLLTLLDFVSETLTPFLMKKGQHASAVDLVKISKSEKGGLVLEKLLDVDKMVAEFIPYRSGWKREEVSAGGNFKPALQRLANGDRHTRSMMCTGLLQIAGSRAGELDDCYRFVEFDLGGLSLLTKARAHAQKDGQNIDIAHKNFYYQNEVKALTTYFKMILGKTDKTILAIQRSGKIHQAQVCCSTLEDIVEKQPLIKEAAQRRLGRLVALLKEVQKSVESESGPWVLQWQRGQHPYYKGSDGKGQHYYKGEGKGSDYGKGQHHYFKGEWKGDYGKGAFQGDACGKGWGGEMWATGSAPWSDCTAWQSGGNAWHTSQWYGPGGTEVSHPAAANPTMPMAMLENDRAQAQDLPSEVLGVKIMVDKLRTAEDVKWFYEEGARLYNASMLPLEEAELRGYKWPTLKDQADMAKVMGNFGCMRGATQNGQRLLKTFVKGMDFAPASQSPEAETLLRAQQYWAKLRHRSWSDWDETQLQAFDHLLAARKFGPHELLHPQESSDQGMSWLQGLVSAEWCFLGIVMGMLLTMDALLLQNLPESRRSHVCVLLIWLAVTLACCVEVWVCAGADAGTTWLFGYLMELLYSADHVWSRSASESNSVPLLWRI